MPSAKTHTALSRQWELLQQLPKRAPGITVSELLTRLTTAGYSISRRSIERDLRPVPGVSVAVQRWRNALRLVLEAGRERRVAGHHLD